MSVAAASNVRYFLIDLIFFMMIREDDTTLRDVQVERKSIIDVGTKQFSGRRKCS